MPWTIKQHKLFEAAANNPAIAKRVGITVNKAKQMASEGIKAHQAKLADALIKNK